LLIAYDLGMLSSDVTGKLDVIRHDGKTLGMDGTQVGVFKNTNRCLLKCHDSRGLEAEVSLEVLGNLSDKVLEGQLADEEFSGLLVVANFTKSDCTWVVTMGLLHASSNRGRFASSLGSQLFPWGLAASRQFLLLYLGESLDSK
jgi:hypothetical protein